MHQGGCLCGAVRYRVDGAAARRRSSATAACAGERTARRRRTRPARVSSSSSTRGDDLRWHEHDGARRGFCAVCGSRLFWDRGRPTISIAAGSVDEPTGLTTSRHIYTESAGDWDDAGRGGRR